MKKSELITKLMEIDGDFEVVFYNDDTGAGEQVNCVSDNAIIDPWREIFLHHLTPELEEQGYTEDDVYTLADGERNIVLST